jgi:hypothetical protein
MLPKNRLSIELCSRIRQKLSEMWTRFFVRHFPKERPELDEMTEKPFETGRFSLETNELRGRMQ